MLSILSPLAFCATAPSANAAACVRTAGTKFALCLGEPLVLTEGSFTLRDETDTPDDYIGKSPSVTTECTAVKGVGTLTAKAGSVTTLNLRLEYSSCRVPLPTGCTIKEPITTEPLKGVIEELKRGDILVTPQTGENFGSVQFENKGDEECLIAGTDTVKLESGGKGGELCTTASLETTRILQLATCTGTNSHLAFRGERVTFAGNVNMKLLSKTGIEEKWAIIEGT